MVTVGAKTPPEPPDPIVRLIAGAFRRRITASMTIESFPAMASSTQP